MLSVILIPLTLHLLPVYSFTIGHRLGLTKSLLVLLLLGIAYLHSLYGSIIQDMDNTTANTRLQILGAESLALNVEIRNIEIKDGTERMPHHLLLIAVAVHLTPQELTDNVYFAF